MIMKAIAIMTAIFVPISIAILLILGYEWLALITRITVMSIMTIISTIHIITKEDDNNEK